jgi:epoxyqueuosine reductase
MTFPEIETAAVRHGLFAMGGFHPEVSPDKTMILLGADTGFWPVFRTSAEFADGQKDPVDRWSKRIISDLAQRFAATDFYPSDGPPYAPFIAWARATGRFYQSPTGMLVHDRAGLMVSIRGALLCDAQLDLPQAHTQSPCEDCPERPCETSCPVEALSPSHAYDVPRCKSYLDTRAGQDCMQQGCRVRRACPVSQSFQRDPDQSAFHMKAFHTP